jgi:predicted TIM-barrel fold metal-dependent hydrolase
MTALSPPLSTAATLSRIKVIDADSHIAEPPDLWTSRVSKKFGDAVPHLVHDDKNDLDRWLVGDRMLTAVANWATAGWHEHPPQYPRTMEQADPGAFQALPRLQRMDEYGVWAQALYPNLLAFSNHAFMQLPDPELRIGHHGVLFIAKPHKMGLPRLKDKHWEPIFSRVQEMGWSINFHVGFADFSEDEFKSMLGRNADRADYAKLSAVAMLNNGESIADVIMSGVCHQYPGIKFVSVESGYGWLPSFVESLDWQWLNSGAAEAYPQREMPSFYFRRQIMGMFWFEQESIRRLADLYPDNLMFETDFPHPTSLSPGPASSAENPRAVVRKVFEGLPAELAQKVLYENAAGLYHLDGS